MERSARGPLPGSALVAYRLRVVRIGIQTTVFAVAALSALPFLSSDPSCGSLGYWLTLAAAVAGVGIVALLPWRRLFERGLGVPCLYVWSTLDIVLITLLVVFTGAERSPLYLVYFLTTVFFAASYPPAGQIGLMGFTYAAYGVALFLGGWDISPAALLLRFSMLGLTAFMASFIARELLVQSEAAHRSGTEAARRAELLGTVARAARAMTMMHPDEVLHVLVNAAVTFGFDAGELCVLDDDSRTYTIQRAKGLPAAFVAARHPADRGLVGRVLAAETTVVVDDWSAIALPQLRDAGFTSAIGSPIWIDGSLSAVLIAGAKKRRDIGSDEIEAFNMLAVQAGLALEAAHRFERERQTVERLEELDRLKSDFLNTVSHELRTPLTAIEGMGLTLQQRWDLLDDELRKELLDRLNANAMALDGIVGMLLDFSRLESGRMTVAKTIVDLRETLPATVRRLDGLFEGQNLRIELDGSLEVDADPALIERVVENLLANAAKYCPAGSDVRLRAYERGSEVVVEVQDDGPGISPQDLRHVGERFYRGDAGVGSVRGTGLGLALVKEILGLHSTELKIESDLGAGSRFSFSLRRTAGSETAPPNVVAERRAL